MRTIYEVLIEVKDIIDTHYLIDDRIHTLEKSGYRLIYTWVKNGGVGSYYYHARRKIFRIQVSESEIRGHYSTAWFIELTAIIISDK
jgi:hypothetical protein